MQAIVQEKYGTTERLALRDVERPEIGAGEVLLEVHAAGLDRGVWHVMTGTPYLVRLVGFGLTKPKQPIPGMDVAGRVVAIGADVTAFTVGDEVFGIGIGTFAEYASAREDKLVHKPAELSFVAASAVAISGLTAQQAVHDIGQLQAGQQVLIIGASGGVGSYAVQLARAAGAVVTGVCSSAKADLVRSLGADHVIDYTSTDVTVGSTRYDLIIDIGGRTKVSKLRRVLTRTGTLVMVGGEDGGRFTGGVGRQIRGMVLSLFVRQRLTTFVSAEDHDGIDRLRARIEAGDLVPAVGRTYRLDQLPDAIQDLESGHISGKSVIEIRPAD